ncbi:hypothetical protein ACVNF4_35160 [Streptomyces sp. S6]
MTELADACPVVASYEGRDRMLDDAEAGPRPLRPLRRSSRAR